RCAVNTERHLFEEAEALWAAEQQTAKESGPLAASWGAVGLLVNPNSNVDKLTAAWSERVRDEHRIYRHFPAAVGETPAVTANGLLTIPWPPEATNLVDVDFLLATATKPDFIDGRYAIPSEIAVAWKQHPHRREYFDNNRQNGILTSFD